MRPFNTTFDCAYKGLTDPVLLCNRRVRARRFVYRQRLLLCELMARMIQRAVLAHAAPALKHIAGIFSGRAYFKVLRVHAERIITGVTNDHSFGNGSMHKLITEPVRLNSSRRWVELESPVAGVQHGGSPQPTFIWCPNRHLLPEPFFGRLLLVFPCHANKLYSGVLGT